MSLLGKKKRSLLVDGQNEEAEEDILFIEEDAVGPKKKVVPSPQKKIKTTSSNAAPIPEEELERRRQFYRRYLPNVKDYILESLAKYRPEAEKNSLNTSSLFMNDGFSVRLCKQCVNLGKMLENTEVDNIQCIVVPICNSCGRANQKIRQAEYHQIVIKNFHDMACENASKSGDAPLF